MTFCFKPDSYTGAGSGYEVSFCKMGFMSAAYALCRSETDSIRAVIAPMLAK